MAEDLNKDFSKEDTDSQQVHEPSPVTREVQIKTIMKYPLTPLECSYQEDNNIPSADQDVHLWRKHKLVQPLKKRV